MAQRKAGRRIELGIVLLDGVGEGNDSHDEDSNTGELHTVRVVMPPVRE